MNTMKNPPPGDQGLAFQTHALQMILFGPFYVRAQHRYGSSRIKSLQDRYKVYRQQNWKQIHNHICIYFYKKVVNFCHFLINTIYFTENWKHWQNNF